MKKNSILMFSIIAFFIIIYIIEPIIKDNIKVFIVFFSIIIVFSYFIYMFLRKKKINMKHIIYIIIIIGILLRSMYIVYTPTTQRQHDVYGINDEGHLGYIYRIYETGKLPQTNNIQFYHPPLFHSIAAGWLRVNTIFGVELIRSVEGIQILTGIFSSLTIIVAYKIVEKLKIKDIYKVLIMALMTFHPTFILLSGSINNDCLLTLLTFMIILYLIKWNENNNIKNTIVLAIVTGCTVMTKVSGAIMAIPIAMAFIDKFAFTLKRDEQNTIKLIVKFLLFGLISLPLGLWHPIRNLILFNQPIGGVLIPSQSLYIGNYSMIERFFSISFREVLKNIYCVIPGEYNVLSSIIKTSVLGEFSYDNIIAIATMIKLLNLLLIIFSTIFIIILTIKNSKKDDNYFIIKILLIIWAINIISYYAFNIQYPYFCTMNFRYLVPTLFTGIVAIAAGTDKFVKNNLIKDLLKLLIMVFCVISITMFICI